MPDGAAPADSLDSLIARRFGLAAADARGAQPGTPPSATLAALLDRRVTRRFRPDTVPESVLDLVLAAAQSAPSKSDLQQYSIVVLTDPGPIGRIADWIGTMAWIKAAPVFLVFCADIHRGREICRMHGMAHANDNLDTFLNAAVDAALALGFAMHAADALGLGSCPVSELRDHLERITPLLGLPEAVLPLSGLALGWPEHRALPSMRLPPSVVVHRGRYQAAQLVAEIAAYDSRRHAREPLSAGRQKHRDIFGAKDVLTWSENAARQLSVPERFGLRAFLRTRGLAID